MDDDILTIEEVAKYLRVSERTVYDWAQKGEIPSGKIGTVWRFKKSEIEKWVNDRLSSGARQNTVATVVQIKNILSPDRIIFLNHATKRDALLELAANLSTAPQVKNGQELAVEILKIAEKGLKSLKTGEEKYLEPIKELTFYGKTPADIILQNWNGCWGRDLHKLVRYLASGI